MNRLLHRIALLLPYLLIVAYIAGLSLSLFLGIEIYAIDGTILAIPAILASLFLIVSKKEETHLEDQTHPFLISQRLLALLFFCIFIISVSILLFSVNYYQFYLIFVILLYFIIIIHIFSNGSSSLILAEIILTLANMIYSTTFRFPFYFGNTDIMSHVFLTQVISTTGHIVSSGTSIYSFFPLYHILIGMSSDLLGLEIKTTLFLITCPIYCLIIIFFYFICNHIIKNNQIALLSCLMLSINSNIVFTGTYMIPKAMGFVAFIILLYILFKIPGTSKSSDSTQFSLRILSVFIAIFIILVHHVNIIFYVFILLLLIFGEWIIRSERYFLNSFFILFVSLAISYWINTAIPFIQQAIIPRTKSDLYVSPFTTPAPKVIGLNYLTGNLDTLIFIFLLIIGISYILLRQKPNYTVIVGMITLSTLFVIMPSPLSSNWQLFTLLQLSRLQVILTPFFALTMGIGLFILAKSLSKKRSTVIILFLIIGLISVTYSIGSLGILEDTHTSPRLYFDEGELVGCQYVFDKIPYGLPIFSDYPTAKYFNPEVSNKSEKSEPLNLPYYQTYLLGNISRIPIYPGYIVFPEKTYLNNGLSFGGGNELDPNNLKYIEPSESNTLALESNFSKINLVYSNDYINIYSPLFDLLHSPPIILPLPNWTATPGELLTFQISAIDPLGRPLTYMALSLPSGASFDNKTHTFSWIPPLNQSKWNVSAFFEVSNGMRNAFQYVYINMNIRQNVVQSSIPERLKRFQDILSSINEALLPVGYPSLNQTIKNVYFVHEGESINNAIQKANNGDIIFVTRGHYYENINLYKRIDLYGVDRPIIDGVQMGSPISITAEGARS